MGKYVWPCPSYSRISSGYGNRTCPFHGKEFHDGVDLAAASGAPILAFGPGTVTKSGWYGGYGNYISIDHGGGLMSFYGHASALYVKQGAKVTAGQKIAAVGTTGSSTGCHLHFGMHKNGSSVNPLNYVSSGDTLAKYSGSKSSGTATNTVKALFTAYYPANNAMEGGFFDALGNKLDPSKHTCAAPPSVPFGTKITVRDTGTSLDGTTFTVNDRGGAIQIKNGVYHFDLLMSSNAECNRWGRKNGSAIIGGSGGGSGSAVSFINTALGEVGYKESGKDINKFGQWAGHNGVAWCVYFVCWCAAKSGAPIPTSYGYVGDMSSYFKARGKYKSAGSYKPKAGDLMIQGDRHIGIVISAGASSFETVEGNYSNSVKRVTRSYGEVSGFCTPWG